MGSFKDLLAWQKGMALAEETYVLTASFPGEERYGLTAQMRRRAISVPSNIAEGQGRATARDFQRFLAQARGSLLELETQLILATRLGFGSNDALHTAIEHAHELGRIINGLITSMDRRPPRKPATPTDN